MTVNENTFVEENDEIVTLSFDDGVTEDFYNLAELDFEGKWYIFLAPVEPDEQFAEDEVLIYEMVGTGDDEEFLPIEDEELLDKLINLLNEEVAR